MAKKAQSPAQNASEPTQFTNTNKWTTKELAIMALMCAIGVLLSFIEIPLIPGVSFLRYDASLVPALVCGFAYSGGIGVTVGIICAVIHALFTGNWVGAVMNIIVAIAVIAPAASIYHHHRTFKGAIVALVVSAIVMIVAACIANLVIDPLFYGIPFEAVQALIVPALIPFNIAKAVINAVITLIVYKSISNLITPVKNQVRGR